MQGYPPPSGYGPPSQQGYYGGPPPKKGMHGCLIALIIGGILTVCMFGGCLVLGMVGAATTPRTSSVTVRPAATSTTVTTTTAGDPTPTRTAKPKPTGMAVTSAKLWNDYQANEVSADDRYKGKKLLVTGSVASIDKDFTGSIVVRLSTPNEFMSVAANMDSSEKSKAARLSKGSQVTVACEGDGMVIGSPMLTDCKLASNGSSDTE